MFQECLFRECVVHLTSLSSCPNPSIQGHWLCGIISYPSCSVILYKLEECLVLSNSHCKKEVNTQLKIDNYLVNCGDIGSYTCTYCSDSGNCSCACYYCNGYCQWPVITAVFGSFVSQEPYMSLGPFSVLHSPFVRNKFWTKMTAFAFVFFRIPISDRIKETIWCGDHQEGCLW